MDCFTAEWSTAIYNVTDPTIENKKETRTGSLFPFSFTKRCSQIVFKKRTASRSKVNGIGQHSNKLKETTTTQISGFSRTTAKGIVYACRVNTGAVGRACLQCVRSFLLIDVIFFWPGFFLAEGGRCFKEPEKNWANKTRKERMCDGNPDVPDREREKPIGVVVTNF